MEISLTARYPRGMSQVLPPLSRARKARLAKLGLRAASDTTGLRTYRAFLREVHRTERSSMTQAANRVTAAMTLPKR